FYRRTPVPAHSVCCVASCCRRLDSSARLKYAPDDLFSRLVREAVRVLPGVLEDPRNVHVADHLRLLKELRPLVAIECRKAGWRIVRVWEHDVLRKPERAAAKVIRALRKS